ncbi:MAG: hypothetical protein K2L28_07750 [Muribaculaceae bacterium]|nr:hypothetical protein [Muribaculaceae bacterium]
MPKRFCRIITAVFCLLAAATVGCDSIDDDRIPVTPVNLRFTTVAEWNVYGVPGALSWKRFIREERIPSNFPYTEMTYTGFGGILLVADVMGNPKAFDLACPVERRSDVRVAVKADDKHLAVCPKCGSKYDVFSLSGHPVSGEASEKGFALRQYYAGAGRNGDYMVVANR